MISKAPGFASITTLILCASIGLFTGQTASAAWILEFDRELSTTIFENGFINPTSLSLDDVSGELCVTDRAAQSVRILNTKGIATFKTNSLAGLSLPTDTSLDPLGGFIFTDSHVISSRGIKRLDFRGEPLTFEAEEPASQWHPEHLLLTRDGHIITVDSNRALICKHDLSSGDLVWQRNLAASEEGIRNLVTGRPAEGPDGKIYIPMSNLHLVRIYSPDGEVEGSFGIFGSTKGRMVFPTGVGFGQEQTILVLDRMRNKVLLFDSQLKFQAEFGSYGLAPGQIYHPHAMAVSTLGVVFISQGYQGRIQTFRLRNTTSSPTALLEPSIERMIDTKLASADAAPWLQANRKGGQRQHFTRITRFAPTNSATSSDPILITQRDEVKR